MANLGALAYTAYLASVNGIENQRVPLYQYVDPNSSDPHPTLLNALNLHGEMIADPRNAAGFIYAPHENQPYPLYAGETPYASCENIGSYFVAQSLFPEIPDLLSRVGIGCQVSASALNKNPDPYYPFDDGYPEGGITQLYLTLTIGLQ
jgi:hypothetical protein